MPGRVPVWRPVTSFRVGRTVIAMTAKRSPLRIANVIECV